MSRTTHVVVDARLAWGSGIGTYIRNVVPAIARLSPDWRFTLITARADADAAWAALPNVQRMPASADIYSIREQIELVARMPRHTSLYWATHYNFPLLLTQRLVVTVHDLAHLRLPEFTRSTLRHAYARVMFGMVRARATGLLFDSQFTRNEFDSLVGASNGTSAVVHLGVAQEWFQPTSDEAREPLLRQPYFVYVGNIKAHKNLPTLLAAFEVVRGSIDARLVLIGKSEDLRTPDDSIRPRVASMEGVSLAGELDGAAVRRLVRNATALVLPSFYEGFGFPPLEAMAAGCPAIVARAGSLPEVCGDAAKYFEPHSVDQLALLMLEVERDSTVRAAMIERGRIHARTFDWGVTAVKTRALLERVLFTPRGARGSP